ncbi:MAG: methyl-accepting chemotaxis protein [Pseudorhodoplanes sp.]|nr:methyl-accepting chemotaxis protein [Pseudorhodoplanes sp.]
MSFPHLSIAAKLYAIFALLATVTIALAGIAAINSREHARLTAALDTAYSGVANVERVQALIHAAIAESQGIFLAADDSIASDRAAALKRLTDRIADVMGDWQRTTGADDAEQLNAFSGRIWVFRDYRKQIADRAIASGADAARQLAEFDEAITGQTALSKNLEQLAQIYVQRAQAISDAVERTNARTTWLMTTLGAVALLLAAAGAFTLWRAVVRPLAEITRVTKAVADKKTLDIPYRGRRDEIGALASSVAIFQAAMRHNDELNKTVSRDAAARAQRQDEVGAEIQRFSLEAEVMLAQLASLSEAVRKSAKDLAGAVEVTSDRTTRAIAASGEANSNVRDIASAADELAASVLEIERQVSQANSIAIKAVGEAEQTNATVKELSDAAGRIGDVIRLITDIAEQTNLLALNATIEAARAGDAGLGFAVVAGEVKALAGQTARATEEIGAQIAAMQQATERSIFAIGAIERTIREIGDISGAIAAAVTEQGAATQEIARSVEAASQRSSETADQINRVNEATASTGAHALQARNVADDLGAVASRIRAQIDEFFKRLRAA